MEDMNIKNKISVKEVWPANAGSAPFRYGSSWGSRFQLPR